jgi:PncC family amidohydrolase
LPDRLALELGEALKEKGWRLGIAESCTGGLVSAMVTDVSGSSKYFAGAVCAYANEAKVRLLGVPEGMLAEHGAVSEEVAVAMAEGARQRFSAEVGLSVTGVAGPEGGTAEKPVGLVYVAVVVQGRASVMRHEIHGDRQTVRGKAARAALMAALDKVKSA